MQSYKGKSCKNPCKQRLYSSASTIQTRQVQDILKYICLSFISFLPLFYFCYIYYFGSLIFCCQFCCHFIITGADKFDNIQFENSAYLFFVLQDHIHSHHSHFLSYALLIYFSGSSINVSSSTKVIYEPFKPIICFYIYHNAIVPDLN